MIRKRLSRRTFLKSASATIALPWLESMTPLSAAQASTVATEAPRRLMFLSYPYGVTEEAWFPKTAGAKYEMPKALKPLERYRKYFSVVSNLSSQACPSVHSGCTTFLTCADVYRNPSIGFSNTVSCDQLAAEHFLGKTRLPSLTLTEKGEGGMGPGSSLAWDSRGSAIPGEGDPMKVFNKLFTPETLTEEQQRDRLARKESVLDTILDDAKRMERVISSSDKDKLDEYFTSVRQMERQLEETSQWIGKPKPKSPLALPEAEEFKGSQKIKLMYDLMVAALQTDQTRVCSYRQPLNVLLKELESGNCGSHQMSHYKGHDSRYEVSLRRDILQAQSLAYLIHKLGTTKDVAGNSLLDQTLVAYGSNIRTVHMQRNIPFLLAGGTGTGVKQGQHYVFEENDTPLANMWLSMLQHTGVQAESFSNSNGTLKEIFPV
ncbi:DUF1552 domain-containing protein [Persicirhabdus sediminis]|uniref:DUF1552 domain-containing protein n=1 Tax=Persicirhabdus sediminis TaxID=454144 RepID=A0A8J7MBG5_9BACT|nr:DUF1552 domain-containing protein [Persicirhabdus sediminis]MBK1790367.1 DUF1552 domain-containing protein [Persicirhabdus sediminis]